MKIRFSKMQGLGNDFIVIDAINQKIDTATQLSPENIRRLADRHFGIGCDQLLLVEQAQNPDADFRYRIFNADGSEVNQCGNGARCFARFVHDQGLSNKNPLHVETANGTLQLHLDEGGLITVNMGIPQRTPEKIPFTVKGIKNTYTIEVDNNTIEIGVVSMGNPHAILHVSDITTAAVDTIGPAIAHHPLFPEQVNVGFMQILDQHRISLRVFERGAGETLACGSGACAAVVIGQIQGLLQQRVLVELAGGNLFIQWSGKDAPVFMTGPAIHVFEGAIEI